MKTCTTTHTVAENDFSFSHLKRLPTHYRDIRHYCCHDSVLYVIFHITSNMEYISFFVLGLTAVYIANL